MNSFRLELLAPAKNLECGIAAIRHGADAVYMALLSSEPGRQQEIQLMR